METVREALVGAMRERREIPAGVSAVITGAADQLDATREALIRNDLVALAVIYQLIVAIF